MSSTVRVLFDNGSASNRIAVRTESEWRSPFSLGFRRESGRSPEVLQIHLDAGVLHAKLSS